MDISSGAMAYPVPLSAMAAGDVEIFMRVILGKLFRRQPFPQEPETTRFAFISVP
jgi:hypothetical protein